VAAPDKPTQSNSSLKGIWKDKGFEKIIDLDAELKEARQELGSSILARKF
jgi:hypothetical protein